MERQEFLYRKSATAPCGMNLLGGTSMSCRRKGIVITLERRREVPRRLQSGPTALIGRERRDKGPEGAHRGLLVTLGAIRFCHNYVIF